MCDSGPLAQRVPPASTGKPSTSSPASTAWTSSTATPLVGAAAARGVSPAGLRRLSTLVDAVTDRWLPAGSPQPVTA